MTKTDHTEHAIAKLSGRLTVELTAGLYGMTAEWIPELPERLTGAELQAYRSARNALLERLAERLGGKVLVVEV